MRDLPAGTVTFLFTDIEGSTNLLHELGVKRYAQALEEHRHVLRGAFARHGGVEVDTQGDAFFVAFPTAQGAVRAAAEAQAELAGGVLVRMGLHTGDPHLTQDGYVGSDVHLGARVAAAGYGGQVLLTRTTVELIEGEAETKDLGEHRLKDFADAVWIYQLGSGEFPPLRSLNNTNLPTPASSFLGRETELAEAADLLSTARLLTISGPGGAGKTRFAIELASRQLERFRNGVFWVPLFALRDPGLVLETIAQTLGAKSDLASHIGSRRMLLVLDNFEQVVGGAPAVAELLSSCPNLGALVTSRELLRVQGEVAYALPPLGAGEDAALFCLRARCEPSPAIDELCRRLDGLPLAIELAAARMAVFTPEQLLERLGQRLDLLKGGRDADPRQQTLRAAIQWSYDLLDTPERAIFRRIGVFAGGSTLEAAEEVAGADVDALQSLVEKSLLRRTGTRFWMLETIREFALAELQVEDEAAAARSAYQSWMLRLAEKAGVELERPDQDVWLELVRQEQGNVREVLTLALDAGEGEVALRIAAALSRSFWLRPAEPLAWLERGLAVAECLPPELRADALRAAGEAAWFLGDHGRALERFQEGLTLFRELGDEAGIAKMLARIGPPLMSVGRFDEAAELLGEAAELERRLGLEHEHAITVGLLAGIALRRGDLGAAEDLFSSSLALARELGDSMIVSNALMNLAEIALLSGDADRAEGLIREALETAWDIHDWIGVIFSFALLAWASSSRGERSDSARFWGAAERLDAELGETMWRNERADYEARLDPEVLADEAGLAEGRALETEEAVGLAVRHLLG